MCIYIYTLQGTNISHLGKRKIIFKSALGWDYAHIALVFWHPGWQVGIQFFFNPFQFHRVTVSLKLSKCLRPPKRKTSTNLNQQLSNRASHRIRILLSEQEHRFFVTYCLYRLTLHLMVNSHPAFYWVLTGFLLFNLQTSIMDISLAKVNWALQATNTQAAWNMIEALSKQSTITQLPLSKNWIFSEMIISAGQHEDATVLEKYRNTAWVHLIKARTGREIGCKCTVYIQKHAGQLTQKHAKGNYCFGRIESSNYLFLPQIIVSHTYEKPNIGKWDWVRTYEEVSIQRKKDFRTSINQKITLRFIFSSSADISS